MNILHIESSIFNGDGVSTQLSRELVEKLLEKYPNANITKKNFAEQPMPHFDASYLGALMTAENERVKEQEQQVAFADKQIEELKQAELLVLSVPMYNFSVPSMLKAWFDFVARAGVTFKYTDQGPVGLLENKKAIVIFTRGGKYKGTAMDSQTPFIESFLKFLGIDNIDTVYAEELNMGDEPRQRAIDEAKQALAQLVA